MTSWRPGLAPCRQHDIANRVGHGVAEGREVALRLFLNRAKRGGDRSRAGTSAQDDDGIHPQDITTEQDRHDVRENRPDARWFCRLTTAITKEDVYGGIACFCLVFISCLPASLPFFFFSSPHLALRISNFLLIALLFLVGQKWAQYAGTNRLAAGAAMVAIGLLLVGIAIPLGG